MHDRSPTLFLILITTCSATAFARPQYLKAFVEEYPHLRERALEAKCGLCHPNKSKKVRNDYGRALAEHTGRNMKSRRDLEVALRKTAFELNGLDVAFAEWLAVTLPGRPFADREDMLRVAVRRNCEQPLPVPLDLQLLLVQSEHPDPTWSGAAIRGLLRYEHDGRPHPLAVEKLITRRWRLTPPNVERDLDDFRREYARRLTVVLDAGEDARREHDRLKSIALSSRADPESSQFLAECLTSNVASLRNAARAVPFFNSRVVPGARIAYVERVLTDNELVRSAILAVPDAFGPWDDLESHVERFVDSDDEAVRIRARVWRSRLVAPHQPPIDQLVDALRSADASAREFALHELGTCGRQALPAFATVLPLINDENPRVVAAAVDAVQRIQPHLATAD